MTGAAISARAANGPLLIVGIHASAEADADRICRDLVAFHYDANGNDLGYSAVTVVSGGSQVASNSGAGQFSATAGELHFFELFMTKRACDGPAGQMEAAVLRVLQAESVSYRIEAGTLELDAGCFGLQLAGR